MTADQAFKPGWLQFEAMNKVLRWDRGFVYGRQTAKVTGFP